ncbi:PIN domain-containing protein [Candidatus Woesearchaeota archaeon]|nr:PIN domain-containing protein [Candidatus Woesearchaeota archaeon]
MSSFVDSNVMIYAFTNNDRKEECRSFLSQENLVTNTLVLLESYAKISTINSEEYSANAIKGVLGLGNITIVDFTSNLLFESLRRSQKYALKISDLVHFTTALLNNCSQMISYDKHFDGLEITRSEP